jgi:hypothetical protein
MEPLERHPNHQKLRGHAEPFEFRRLNIKKEGRHIGFPPGPKDETRLMRIFNHEEIRALCFEQGPRLVVEQYRAPP